MSFVTDGEFLPSVRLLSVDQGLSCERAAAYVPIRSVPSCSLMGWVPVAQLSWVDVCILTYHRLASGRTQGFFRCGVVQRGGGRGELWWCV